MRYVSFGAALLYCFSVVYNYRTLEQRCIKTSFCIFISRYHPSNNLRPLLGPLKILGVFDTLKEKYSL